jgi:hypothetical protein
MAFIKTLGELADAGGPETLARKAAREAAQSERRLWLDVLEAIPGAQRPDIAHWWARDLRRKLGLRQPKDVVRAQTRERVRRYRERQRAATHTARRGCLREIHLFRIARLYRPGLLLEVCS